MTAPRFRVADYDAAPRHVPVPPANLDERVISRHGKDGQLDSTMEALIAAAASAKVAARDIAQRAHDISLDASQSKVANQVKARKVSFALVKRSADRIDLALRNATTAIAQIDALAPDLPETINGAEVRATLARMSPMEKTKALADPVILGAVMRSHPTVSGLDVSQVKVAWTAWMMNSNKTELDRKLRLERARRDLERMGKSLLAWTDLLTDGRAIADAAKSAAAAADAEKVATDA